MTHIIAVFWQQLALLSLFEFKVQQVLKIETNFKK